MCWRNIKRFAGYYYMLSRKAVYWKGLGRNIDCSVTCAPATGQVSAAPGAQESVHIQAGVCDELKEVLKCHCPGTWTWLCRVRKRTWACHFWLQVRPGSWTPSISHSFIKSTETYWAPTTSQALLKCWERNSEQSTLPDSWNTHSSGER